jgi:hypothetical protein
MRTKHQSASRASAGLGLVCRRAWVADFELLVLRADRSCDTAGDSERDDPAREVLGHDAARADHGTRADGDPRHDDDAAADPDVVFDVDGQRVLASVGAERGFDRMSCRGDGDVRPEQDAVTDVDVGVVDDHEIEVRVEAFADGDVGPVGRQKRWLDPDRVAPLLPAAPAAVAVALRADLAGCG